MPNIKTKELRLFYKTIEEIKSLRIFNFVSDEEAGNDFHIEVNDNLLNPSFRIYEVYGGETLVDGIIFDRHEQEFYDKGTDEMLSSKEVVQEVKRGLIPWITGKDYTTIKTVRSVKNNNLRKIEDLKGENHEEFIKTLEELTKSQETLIVNSLDMDIKIFEADCEEEVINVIHAYRGTLTSLYMVILQKYERLKEIEEKSVGKRNLLSKITNLLGSGNE